MANIIISIFGLIMAFFVPGMLLSLIILPNKNLTDKIVHAFLLSIVITLCVSLILRIFFDSTPSLITWLVYSGIIIILGLIYVFKEQKAK